MMRLLFAGLFVAGGSSLPVLLLGENGLVKLPPPFLQIGIGGTFFFLCFAALQLFNPAGLRPLDWKEPELWIQELEDKGLLSCIECKATRAFGVEEYEDEGLHYFIEMEDGSLLYLNGQYLYEYEPVEDDQELNQPRWFPCTEFTVRRHRTEGYVVDLLCRGEVLEPEVVAPPFTWEDHKRGIVPEDGQILRDREYDDLKRERLGGN